MASKMTHRSRVYCDKFCKKLLRTLEGSTVVKTQEDSDDGSWFVAVASPRYPDQARGWRSIVEAMSEVVSCEFGPTRVGDEGETEYPSLRITIQPYKDVFAERVEYALGSAERSVVGSFLVSGLIALVYLWFHYSMYYSM